MTHLLQLCSRDLFDAELVATAMVLVDVLYGQVRSCAVVKVTASQWLRRRGSAAELHRQGEQRRNPQGFHGARWSAELQAGLYRLVW